ncbi:hypothetical protein CsSME_00052774 [Camellia sinensis var. sinensis]
MRENVHDRGRGGSANLLLVPERGPQRRLLFLGPRSYKLEDIGADSRGRRMVSVVEQGQGRRSEIVLYGAEIRWLVGHLRQAEGSGDSVLFLGRVLGGSPSVAAWLRSEQDGRVVQVVMSSEQRRQQMFIPSLDGGWEGLALVLEGFDPGWGWTGRNQAWWSPGGRLRKWLLALGRRGRDHGRDFRKTIADQAGGRSCRNCLLGLAGSRLGQQKLGLGLGLCWWAKMLRVGGKLGWAIQV